MKRASDYNQKLRIICENPSHGKINYYIKLPDNRREYAFTKSYAKNAYDLCKAGIRLSDLMTTRSRDHAVMNLVKYVAFIMPYLEEYYDLKRVA